jgi:pyruvate carboxylase
LLIQLEAVSEPDTRGMRTVVATLNGQLRPVPVRDASVAVEARTAEKADRADPGHVAAPFAGVVTLAVGRGDSVAQGQTVATIEAMKMEASISAPRAGTVSRTAIGAVQQVEGGDLLVVLDLH